MMSPTTTRQQRYEDHQHSNDRCSRCEGHMKYSNALQNKRCTNFVMDTRAVYGTCICGKPKSAHRSKSIGAQNRNLSSQRKPRSYSDTKNMSKSKLRSESSSASSDDKNSEVMRTSRNRSMNRESSSLDQYDSDELEYPIICSELMLAPCDLESESKYQEFINVMTPNDESWNRRWAMIHNNFLYLFRSQTSKRPSEVLGLDNIGFILKSNSNPRVLHAVTSAGRHVYFEFDSVNTKKNWRLGLKNQGIRNKQLQDTVDVFTQSWTGMAWQGAVSSLVVFQVVVCAVGVAMDFVRFRNNSHRKRYILQQ